MFTPTQAATLRAAADRIIPPDDFPGGAEGIEGFLEALAAREGRGLHELYAAGLNALDAEALLQAEAPFAALDAEAQDALLASVETDAFFALLARHVVEAYYSDPGNGGNAGARSWKMIGFATL